MKYMNNLYNKTATKCVREQLIEEILKTGPTLYTVDTQLPERLRSYNPETSDKHYRTIMKNVMRQLAGPHWNHKCPHFWSFREMNAPDKLILSESQTFAVGVHSFHYHALFVDPLYPLEKMEKALDKTAALQSLPLNTFCLQPIHDLDSAMNYIVKSVFADENGHCDMSCVIPSDLLFANPNYRWSLFVGDQSQS